MSVSNDLGRALYEFGPFCLDAGQRLLFSSQRPIPLQPKAYETLLVLVRNSDRVVLKDELLSTVWPDTFVEESNLTQNIFVLRKALKDVDPDRRYIVTVPGRGYQFSATVSVRTASNGNGHSAVAGGNGSAASEVTGTSNATGNGHSGVQVAVSVADTSSNGAPRASAVAAGTTRVGVPAESDSKLSRLFWYASACLAIAIVGLAAGVLLYQHYFRAPRVLHVEQLTHIGRVDPWGRINSDGSRLFFISREGDHWNTMQVAAAGGEAQMLSPDSRDIRIYDVSTRAPEMLVAPFQARTGELPLYTMPLVGGSLRRVGNVFVDAAAYSPDGSTLAYSLSGKIYLSDLSGTNSKLLADSGAYNVALAWAPDGKTIRFTQIDANTDIRTLKEVSVVNGAVRSVLEGWDPKVSACCGRWTAEGRYYVFAAETRKQSQVWVLRESGGLFGFAKPKPVQLSVEASFHEPLPSRDGRTIYVQSGPERAGIESINIATRSRTPMLNGARAWEISYSRDGRYIVYTTDEAIWRVNSDGSSPLRLFENSDALFVRHVEWAPDGKHLVMQAERPASPAAHFLIGADGNGLRELPQLGHPFKIADFSPDGTKLVYGVDPATLESHPDQAVLHVYDFNSGKSEPVAGSEGTSGAKWSPDGKHLSAYSNDFKSMRIYEFATQKWRTVATGKYLTSSFWAPDSQYFYFQDLADAGQPVFRVRASDGKKDRVYSFEDVLRSGAQRCGFYGLAPNGDLLIRVTRDGGDLYALTVDLP